MPMEQRKLLGAPGRAVPAAGPQLGLGVLGAVAVGAVDVFALGQVFVLESGVMQVESQFRARSETCFCA